MKNINPVYDAHATHKPSHTTVRKPAYTNAITYISLRNQPPPLHKTKTLKTALKQKRRYEGVRLSAHTAPSF